MARGHDRFTHTSRQFTTSLRTGTTRVVPMGATESCKCQPCFSLALLRSARSGTVYRFGKHFEKCCTSTRYNTNKKHIYFSDGAPCRVPFLSPPSLFRNRKSSLTLLTRVNTFNECYFSPTVSHLACFCTVPVDMKCG